MDDETWAWIEAVEPAYDAAPPFSDADLDRAQAAADVLRAGGDDAAVVGPHELAALSPDGAGRLVEDLAATGRVDALAMVVMATAPHRYPLVTLLRAAAALPAGLYARDKLVRAVAVAPSLRLRSALEQVGDDPTLHRRPGAGGRRPHIPGCRAAVPLVAGARGGKGGVPWERRSGGRSGRRRRSRRGRLPRPRRCPDPQDLSPSGPRRHHAARCRRDRRAASR